MGLIFSVLKFDDAFELLIATLVVTFIFYMIGQVSVSYFVRFVKIRPGRFQKMTHELMLEQFVKDLQKREDIYSQVPASRVRLELESELDAQTGE